jgi:hypothetical protein
MTDSDRPELEPPQHVLHRCAEAGCNGVSVRDVELAAVTRAER